MEVTISVDSTKLTGELTEILKELTSQEKKSICTSVLTAWLNEPVKAEVEMAEKEAVEYVREKNGWLRDSSVEQIKANSEFRERMEGFHSAKWDMVKAIQEEAKKCYAEMIVQKVKTDPQLQQVMWDELNKIKENFGKYVHDAMVAWFCANMSRMTEGIFTALQQSQQANDIIQRINQRI